MNYFIIDFDSTFIKNESLDILFEISDPNNNDKIREIKKITDLGMNGHISFSESLKRRIKSVSYTHLTLPTTPVV